MNKITELQIQEEQSHVLTHQFNHKQIEILKNSICKGVSIEEFETFLMACTKTGLDPFMKQIYAVKRKSKRPDGSWGDTMTIQTGIDGYRLIAERTGRYAPGPEPTYTYDQEGRLQAATAYIKKMTRDGTWHLVSASAFYDEYCQKKSDGTPMGLWATMPRTMLAKCSESICLRKSFPAEMSGVYTKEEMAQAEVIIPKMTLEQVADLQMILDECEDLYRKWVYEHLRKSYKTDNLSDLPADLYEKIKQAAVKNMEENHTKQKSKYKEEESTDSSSIFEEV